MAKRRFPLSCLHFFVAEMAPRHGDLVWCQECKDYRTVGVPPRDDYTVNCVNCKRMRDKHYGDAFVTAETRAVTHSLKHAGHKVTLSKNGVVVRVYDHPAMPVDIPPF
jgi:hypothetical protein